MLNAIKAFVEIQPTIIQESQVSVEVPAIKKWTFLFRSLLKTTGTFSPSLFNTVMINGVSVPPAEVVQEGMSYRSDYLVHFFLGTLYTIVRDKCKQI